MKYTTLVAAAVLAASPVLAQSTSQKSGTNMTPGAAPPAADFVKQASVSDIFEIESSKLAQERADAASKKFAAKMVQDHRAASAELKKLAKKANLEIPAAMDAAHQATLDKLKGMQGADFDKEYDSIQLNAHKDAVDLFERYAAGGDNAEIKSFASKQLPHLRQHLKMANDLNAGTAAPRR